MEHFEQDQEGKGKVISASDHRRDARVIQLNNDMIYVALNLAYLPDDLLSKVNFDFSEGKEMFM